MPAPRTPNARGQGGRLREEITAAAARLLGEATSRDAVTLRAIAREAGVSAPSIYLHFGHRDEILDAVVADTFLLLERSCRDAAAGQSTGLDRIRAIGHAYVEFAGQHRSEYRILFERSSGDLAADPHIYPAGIRVFQLFSEAFEQLVAEGTSRSPDPVRDAQALWAALHGVVTLVPATPAFPWAPAADLVDLLMNSLGGAARQ